MKKIIASMIVCGFAVAMVACGGKKTEQAAEHMDSTASKSTRLPLKSTAQ